MKDRPKVMKNNLFFKTIHGVDYVFKRIGKYSKIPTFTILILELARFP